MRLATFNALHGRSPDDDRVDLDRYCAAVRDLDADVLALQEVDRDQPRSSGADLTALAAQALGAREHRFAPALAGLPGSWGAATGAPAPGTPLYGVGLVTRLPVESWRVVRLPALPGRVPVLFPGRRRPVLVRDEPRVAVAARVRTAHGPITVASTHLSFVPWWNAVQLRRLARTLGLVGTAGADGRQAPLVLLGDLNMGPHRAVRSTGLRALAPGLTFPAHAPREQLDHVLARGPLEPAAPPSVRRLPLSDHCALVVDVRWTSGT